MEETIILTFIGKDGVEYTLDYSNNYSVVANIALSAGIEQDILWSLFIEIKNKLKEEIIEEIKNNAITDYEASVLLHCTNLDGVKFDITIFDGEEGYTEKRKKYYHIKYNEKEVERDKKEYNLILDEKIKDIIRSKQQKTKNTGKVEYRYSFN